MGRHRRSREKELDEGEEQLNQMLAETGRKDELKEMLLAKLEECGWRDQVKLVIKDIVKERGIDKITIEDLVQETAPHASQLVPDKVRMEMLDEVKRFLESQDED